MKYSVIIPIYNEEDSIRPLYQSLVKVMEGLDKPYEVIFVNDGSTDQTSEILKSLSSERDNLVTINSAKNQGQSEAFRKGFDKAQGEIIVTLDSDLQNDPKDITALLEKLERGFDVVCGWRRRRMDCLFKRMLSRGANASRRLFLGENIHDVSCSLRVYRRKFIKDVDLSGQMYYMLTAILSLAGCKIGEVEIEDHPRRFGKSKFNILTKIASGSLIFRYLMNLNKYRK